MTGRSSEVLQKGDIDPQRRSGFSKDRESKSLPVGMAAGEERGRERERTLRLEAGVRG